MSEATQNENVETNEDLEDSPMPSEIDLLKQRAMLMGIKFHPSISVENLKKRIAEKEAGIEPTGDGSEEETNKTKVTNGAEAPVETENQKRARLSAEATKLVRINVVCMNPAKREWAGEMITGGNSVVGSFKKYVHFNTTEGWHVPNVIYQILKGRKCQTFVNEKTSKGATIRKGKLIPEFAIEVLPPLSQKELDELAAVQAANHSID